MCVCARSHVHTRETYGHFIQINTWRWFFIHRWYKKERHLFFHTTHSYIVSQCLQGGSQTRPFSAPDEFLDTCRSPSTERWVRLWLGQRCPGWLREQTGTGYFHKAVWKSLTCNICFRPVHLLEAAVRTTFIQWTKSFLWHLANSACQLSWDGFWAAERGRR